jgi:hypothetical protein
LGFRLDQWSQFAVLDNLEKFYPERKHLSGSSWAIQEKFSPIEQSLWAERETQMYKLPLSKFVAMLEEQG